MYYVDPIIKKFVRTRQPEGRGAYVRLDQNENPDGVPQWLFEKAMSKVTPEYLSIYPEDTLLTTKYAEKIGFGLDNVTLTDGSVVAMGYVVKVFGEPRKKFICATPTFGMYKVYADMQGMETVFVHYESDYSFDVNKIIKQIDENTSLVSLVNPNMPIGNVYTEDEIVKVIVKAKSVNAIVVIDEAYYYFYSKTALNLIISMPATLSAIISVISSNTVTGWRSSSRATRMPANCPRGSTTMATILCSTTSDGFVELSSGNTICSSDKGQRSGQAMRRGCLPICLTAVTVRESDRQVLSANTVTSVVPPLQCRCCRSHIMRTWN